MTKAARGVPPSIESIVALCHVASTLAEMSLSLRTQPSAWPRTLPNVQLKLQLERADDHAHSRFTGERGCGR